MKIYLQNNLLFWHTRFVLWASTKLCWKWSLPGSRCPAHKAGQLSSPKLALHAWRMPGEPLVSSLYWKDKGAGLCFSKTWQKQQQQWIDELTWKKIQKEDKIILALSSKFFIPVVHFKCATWSWRKTSFLIYCFRKYPSYFLGSLSTYLRLRIMGWGKLYNSTLL